MSCPKLMTKVSIVSMLSIATIYVLFRTSANPSNGVSRDHDNSRDAIAEVIRSVIVNSLNSSISLQLKPFIELTMRNISAQLALSTSTQERLLKLSTDFENAKKSLHHLEKKLQQKQSVIAFLAQPAVNEVNYSYIHNPVDACGNSTLEVLILVPSAPGNFENRLRVRNGYRGEFVRNQTNRAKLLFFIGTTVSLEVQSKIDNESLQHGDVVQGSYVDVYKNIRLKAVSMLKWASTFCQQTDYVIRTDDDIKADLAKVISALKRSAQDHDEFILGRLRQNDHPARGEKNKYSLSLQEYPNETFPTYALGGLLGYPLSSVQLLYQAALRLKPIWLDDIYITGLCAPKVGVELLTDPAFHFQHKSW